MDYSFAKFMSYFLFYEPNNDLIKKVSNIYMYSNNIESKGNEAIILAVLFLFLVINRLVENHNWKRIRIHTCSQRIFRQIVK